MNIAALLDFVRALITAESVPCDASGYTSTYKDGFRCPRPAGTYVQLATHECELDEHRFLGRLTPHGNLQVHIHNHGVRVSHLWDLATVEGSPC